MKFLKIRLPTCPSLQNQLEENRTTTLEIPGVPKIIGDIGGHLDKEIPFRESEIDCDATKTPACVADISVSVADSRTEC